MTLRQAKKIIEEILAWENRVMFMLNYLPNKQSAFRRRLLRSRPHSKLIVNQAWATIRVKELNKLCKPGRFPKNAGKTQMKFKTK